MERTFLREVPRFLRNFRHRGVVRGPSPSLELKIDLQLAKNSTGEVPLTVLPTRRVRINPKRQTRFRNKKEGETLGSLTLLVYGLTVFFLKGYQATPTLNLLKR